MADMKFMKAVAKKKKSDDDTGDDDGPMDKIPARAPTASDSAEPLSPKTITVGMKDSKLVKK